MKLARWRIVRGLTLSVCARRMDIRLSVPNDLYSYRLLGLLLVLSFTPAYLVARKVSGGEGRFLVFATGFAVTTFVVAFVWLWLDPSGFYIGAMWPLAFAVIGTVLLFLGPPAIILYVILELLAAKDRGAQRAGQ